jgi:hypothetical protein
LCYTIGMATFPTMTRQQRMTYGEKNFLKFCKPMVQDMFPGEWHSCNASTLDTDHGVDFIVVNGAQTTTISARCWMAYPQSHFALRWRRTGAIERHLELDSRLAAFTNGELMSDWTIEGFHYQNRSYVAAVPTKILFEHVHQFYDALPTFQIFNNTDSVYFKRIPFIRIHDHVHKFIGLCPEQPCPNCS